MELGEEEVDRVRAAIVGAERKTSAEIFAVLAGQSDDYRFAGYFLAAMAVLAGGFVFSLWAWWRWADIPLQLFAGFQLALVLSFLPVIRLAPGIGMRLVPRRVRRERAHHNAARQFLAHGIHETGGRRGVLVFVSLAERHAEVIADHVVAQRCGQDFWDDVVAVLVDHARRGAVSDGLVTAVGMIGERLAEEFPADADDVNELRDHLVVM